MSAGVVVMALLLAATPALSCNEWWSPTHWTSWGAWSACSTSCGAGTRSTTRNCIGDLTSWIYGSENAYQSCTAGPTYALTTWTAWSACSTTCGTGTIRSTRTCSGCQGDSTCSGAALVQTLACSAGPDMTWNAWANAGPCSTNCGVGTLMQSRSCVGCLGSCPAGSTSQSISCSAGASKDWSAWTTWSACSITCGTGMQTQTRTCDGCVGTCEGVASQSQSCNAGAPKQWTVWADTSTCSSACGAGTLTQARVCLGCFGACDGAATQTISCTGGDTKTWSAWVNSGTCSTACGTGTTTLTRICVGCTGADCVGDATQSITCTAGPERQWSAWADTIPCNVTCGVGVKTQSRTCNGCLGSCAGSATQEVTCSAGAARDWTAWTDITPCNTTCGVGMRTQSRTCIGCLGTCTGPSNQSLMCMAGAVKGWTVWTDTSSCNATCDEPGVVPQSRTCVGCLGSCGGEDTQLKPCSAMTLRTWAAWTNLMPECSSECTVLRARTCEGCVGPSCPGASTNTTSCLIGVWSDWTPIGTCSATCGTKPVMRFCGGCPTGCSGSNVRWDVCSASGVANVSWAAWTCCGSTGRQERADSCDTTHVEGRNCTPDPACSDAQTTAGNSNAKKSSGTSVALPVAVGVCVGVLLIVVIVVVVVRQRKRAALQAKSRAGATGAVGFGISPLFAGTMTKNAGASSLYRPMMGSAAPGYMAFDSNYSAAGSDTDSTMKRGATVTYDGSMASNSGTMRSQQSQPGYTLVNKGDRPLLSAAKSPKASTSGTQPYYSGFGEADTDAPGYGEPTPGVVSSYEKFQTTGVADYNMPTSGAPADYYLQPKFTDPYQSPAGYTEPGETGQPHRYYQSPVPGTQAQVYYDEQTLDRGESVQYNLAQAATGVDYNFATSSSGNASYGFEQPGNQAAQYSLASDGAPVYVLQDMASTTAKTTYLVPTEMQ